MLRAHQTMFYVLLFVHRTVSLTQYIITASYTFWQTSLPTLCKYPKATIAEVSISPSSVCFYIGLVLYDLVSLSSIHSSWLLKFYLFSSRFTWWFHADEACQLFPLNTQAVLSFKCRKWKSSWPKQCRKKGLVLFLLTFAYSWKILLSCVTE